MKRTTKKKAKKEGKEPNKAEPSEAAQNAGDDKLFDFGGLPDRNLKKNLGCG